MLFVTVKPERKKSVSPKTFELDKPMRCYIHEVEGKHEYMHNHWYLVETKKESTPYESDGAKRLFVDPDFPGFRDEGGAKKRLRMEWLEGTNLEEVRVEDNDSASNLLFSESDYDRID